MDGGGAEGSKGGGSSDPRKRKSDKKKDDKPKERKRGFGVAKLEIMRMQSEMAKLSKQNPLIQGPLPQIPDGTTDGLDIAAIRASSYPWSMHAIVSPSLPPPYYPPHLAMTYGYGNAVRGANFGQLSTPFSPPGASGAASYPINPNNIRHVLPSGASEEASYLNHPNSIRPPGASGSAFYPYSNNIMLPINEVTMAQPLSGVPNRQEHIIDLTRQEEEDHNKSAVESTSKNNNDPEDPDLELKLSSKNCSSN